MNEQPPQPSNKNRKKRNIWEATHCSLNFMTLFIAFNTAQNIQSQALEDVGLGKLGFWAIGIMYLSIGAGSMISTMAINKMGEIKCMAVGALFNTPWILSMALCSLRGDIKEGEPMPFYVKSYFISPLILILSILNGLGQGI